MNMLEWYKKIARFCEDDKRLGSIEYRQIEIIAEFVAKEEAAQQSTHADGACPKCGAEGYVILGDGRKYCNVCKTPRR